MNKNKFDQVVSDGFQKIDYDISNKQLQQLSCYMDFLKQENKKYNLTGLTKPKEIIYKHFLDSALIYGCKNFNESGRIIDIGTGAGFPGVVLSILFPQIKFSLVDSRLKRVLFLKKLVANLSIEEKFEDILHFRAEKLGQQKKYRENFSNAVSRAVAPLNILSEYLLPFVKKGGFIFVYKSKNYKEELDEANNAINILGGRVENVYQTKIPVLDEDRVIITIKKSESTPGKYPRANGIPKKSPL